jgi:two-component system, cell cycle sensor histidine kinase and response regulator CckA
MAKSLHVLVISESPDDASLLEEELRRGGYAPTCCRVGSAEAMSAALDGGTCDVVLADCALPGLGPVAALDLLKRRDLDLPVLAICGELCHQDEAVGVMMQAGVHDCIRRSDLRRLVPAVQRELREADQRQERRRAEESLAQARQLWATLMEHLPDQVYFKDVQGRFIRINRAMAEHLGLGDPLTAIGKTDGDFFGPEHARQTMEDEREVMRTGRPMVSKEERQTWPDRRETWVSTTKVSLRNSAGQVTGTFGISRDITERKRAQRERREAQAIYRELAESISDVFFALDEYLVCTYWNKAAESFAGIPPEQAVGKSFYDLFPQAAGSIAEQAYQEVLRTGRPMSFLTEHALGPERLFYEVSVYPLREGVSVFAKDVTDRKRAEEGLRQSQDRYRAMFENSPIALWEEDVSDVKAALGRLKEQGVTDLRAHLAAHPDVALQLVRAIHVTDVNTNALTLLGAHSKQDFLAGLERVALPETIPMFIESFVCLAEGRSGVEVEGFSQTLRGEKKRMLLRWTMPTGQPGGYEKVLVSIIDLTDRARLEEQFRQAQKMEAVGLLAGGVAHDFRNQLTVIRGYAEMLLRRGLVAGKGLDAVGEILKAADRSAVLTGELLAFSRKQVLRPEVIDPSAVLTDLVKPLSRIIGEDVELHVRPGTSVGRVKTDLGLLQQAIMNVVVNARGAMPKGGRLTIALRDVELDEQFLRSHVGAHAGPHVEISFQDTGEGMDAQTLARIFEPFFTTKPLGQGTGLGLAMVYGFIKQSGGYVSVDSRPGQGTTFGIYLPRVTESLAPPRPHAADSHPARGSGTVLVVEDENSVRRVLVETLRELGYAVLDVANAKEALPLGVHYEGAIDLLITDVVLPGMNGVELAEHIRAARPGLRCLFTSGYTGKALEQRGLCEAGASLLAKPFSTQSITEAVRLALQPGTTGDNATVELPCSPAGPTAPPSRTPEAGPLSNAPTA